MKYIVIIFISFALGAVFGWLIKRRKDKEIAEAKNVQFSRSARFFDITDIWLQIFEERRSVKKYFDERHTKTVAIYGIGKLGKHLVKQLQQNHIEVKYIIDNKVTFYQGIDIFRINDKLPETDIIVVTPVQEYKEIRTELKKKVKCEIVSIEDVIYETLE